MLVVVITSIATIYANAQTGEDCSNESLEGAFGFIVSGTNVAANVSFAISGRFVADGQGSFTGTASESTAGNIAQHYPITGSYTVAADCTGSAEFLFPSGASAHLTFALVSDGNEIIILDVDTGSVEYGSAKKQFQRGARQEGKRKNGAGAQVGSPGTELEFAL